MELSFLGACGEVGRSAVLVQGKNDSLLLDCGVKLGEKREYPAIENAKEIKTVLLSHAHLDHSGFLPDLFRLGFRGKVISTKPTRDLTQLLLADYYNIAKMKEDLTFSRSNVDQALKNFHQIEYGKEIELGEFRVTAYEAGHILGASGYRVCQGKKSVFYTGDMNTRETGLLKGAEKTVPKSDVLITESTYSGPEDIIPNIKTSSRQLSEIINTTPGKVLIPVFGVGRGQEIMTILENYTRSGAITKEHGYVDGMITKASRIYRHNVLWLKEEIPRRILLADDDPFKSKFWKTPKTKDKRDVLEKDSAIILATSGMLTGGPSVHYLEKLAPDKGNSIVLVGYQAEGTRGRQLLDGEKTITLKDKEITVKLRVHQVKLSAHADRNDLLKYITENNPKKEAILVHGEKEKQKSFARTLENRKINAVIPELGEQMRV